MKPSAVDKVKQAIKVFVRYVQEHEPGTKMYLAWQEKNDSTRFFRLFIFEDEAAQGRHGESAAVKQFESVYSPESADGDVAFTDYEMITGKPTEQQWMKVPSRVQTATKSSKKAPKSKNGSRR